MSRQSSKLRLHRIGFVVFGMLHVGLPVMAQEDLLGALFADLPTDPDALAELIIEDVSAIRGLEFQRDILVSGQSREDFERYLNASMDRSLPPERADAFGRVVNKLGLYRGPIITDVSELLRMVMTSQAAAYYDPEASAFFVLIRDAPMIMLAPLYAHELYHGLQDQYFDLDAYMLAGVENGLNDDELMARQAVVEGEATYIMTLWTMRQMTGAVVQGPLLDMSIELQAQLDTASLREMMQTDMVSGALGDDLQASVTAMDEIPPFILESMMGAYLKGMGFVHQVVRSGWDNAERLYTDPPRSTEQILHPEKWLERDDPVSIEMTDLDNEPALEGWALLDSNVIGEIQWRIIFGEFGMEQRAPEIAAGWDGDRYAVLDRDGDLMLLLYTTWDSEAEAREFATAYRQLLDVKYQGTDEPVSIDVRGTDVLIAEGGDSDRMPDYFAVLGRARKLD